ncbi:hypothetical protein GCM10009780_74360 [Actinomadura alba]
MCPGKCSKFLGPCADEERRDDVGVHRGAFGRRQNCHGLLEREGFRGEPFSPLWDLAEEDDVALDLVAGLGPFDRAFEDRPELPKSIRAEFIGLCDQPAIHVIGG